MPPRYCFSSSALRLFFASPSVTSCTSAPSRPVCLARSVNARGASEKPVCLARSVNARGWSVNARGDFVRQLFHLPTRLSPESENVPLESSAAVVVGWPENENVPSGTSAAVGAGGPESENVPLVSSAAVGADWPEKENVPVEPRGEQALQRPVPSSAAPPLGLTSSAAALAASEAGMPRSAPGFPMFTRISPSVSAKMACTHFLA